MEARYRLWMRVFGGLDGVMRVVNILRRGKVRYHELRVKFDGAYASMDVCLEGVSDEVRWVAAKVERLPEVEEIRVELPKGEDREEASLLLEAR